MPSPWSRLALLSSLVLLATAPPARAQCAGFAWDNPSPSYPAGVSHHTFTSPSMGVAVGYNVYVPPEYSSGTARYPVIYFLHGIGGDEGTMVANVVTWMRARVAAGLIRPAILVFPNGAVDAAYADAKDGSRRVMTMILDELIPLIDATWRTNACREQRAISGFSMGGHGALLYALRAPERFGSVVAYAPALVEYGALRAEIRACMFGDDPAYYAEFQAETWARTNAATLARGPQIRIVVGDQDGLYAPDVAFDQLLTTLAIPHAFEVAPGCAHAHGCLWDAAGDRGVAVHEAGFAACATVDGDAGVDPGAGDAGGAAPDAGVAADAPAGGCSTGGAPAGPLVVAVALAAIARRRRARAGVGALLVIGCAGPPLSGGADGGDGPGTIDGPIGGADGGGDAPSQPDAATSAVDCARLQVTGTATAAGGARWSYESTDDGVAYRLHGLLLSPAGAGPFPAVVVSHGKGGAASGYGAQIATVMRGWGMVAIATNYSHGSDSVGELPPATDGASPGNLQRARKALALLRCVPAVDLTRIAAHGHSMGAMVTTGLAATAPGQLRAASHTAGGVDDTGAEPAAPTSALAAAIDAPYQLHHGDADTVVPIALDRALAALLAAGQVDSAFVAYPGYSHSAIPLDSTMLARVRTWYQDHGVLP
ncbi:MAG: dienelactone hydrolase family protein [Myxococcales bacterium]|nr:dienelactone hydrolase family protein [Myxococcales bacterium]MBK7192806.1 dienelactone hydrolase family protein [Myxococcales bacterium]